MSKSIKIAIVDDHELYRTTISTALSRFPNLEVITQAKNGLDFIEQVQSGLSPEVVILDIMMPVMDGFETMQNLSVISPETKVIGTSLSDDLISKLKMKKLGAKGFILKSYEVTQILSAINEVYLEGLHFPQLEYIRQDRNASNILKVIENLKERELVFLQFACTPMTYIEIAKEMHVSRFTIDDYSKSLFEKLKVKNRIALILLAMELNLFRS